MSSIFSDHNGRKIENNYKKKTENLKICEKKQHAPEQPMSQKIKGVFEKYLVTNENGNAIHQHLRDTKAVSVVSSAPQGGSWV